MPPDGTPGMKMALFSFVPLGKRDAAHCAAGGSDGTHPGATRFAVANTPPLPRGDFQESSA